MVDVTAKANPDIQADLFAFLEEDVNRDDGYIHIISRIGWLLGKFGKAKHALCGISLEDSPELGEAPHVDEVCPKCLSLARMKRA